jgi:hypothetical protein
MLLRAAFWITVVALFIPRGPDIGYGRPDVPSVVPPRTAAWLDEKFKVPPCVERSHCQGSLSLVADLRQNVLESLERAKADLKASRPPTPMP